MEIPLINAALTYECGFIWPLFRRINMVRHANVTK